MGEENHVAHVDSTESDDEIDTLDNGDDKVVEPIEDPFEDDVYFAPGPPLDGYPDDAETDVLWWRRT